MEANYESDYEDDEPQRPPQLPASISRVSVPSLPDRDPDVAPPVPDQDFAYVSRPSDETSCQICLQPWFQPIEMKPCGHIFCHSCCEPMVEEAAVAQCMGSGDFTPVTCPTCRDAPKSFEKPSRLVCNLVDRLVVRCLKCGFKGERQFFFNPSHRDLCEDNARPLVRMAADWADEALSDGQPKEALLECDRALQAAESVTKRQLKQIMDDQHPMCHLHLKRCRINMAMKNLDDAHTDAVAAREAANSSPEAHYLEAFCLNQRCGGVAEMSKKQRDSTISLLRKAIELKPDYSEAHQLLTELQNSIKQQPSTPDAAAAKKTSHTDPQQNSSTAKVQQTEEELDFEHGALAFCNGLKSAPQYNRRYGTILAIDEDKSNPSETRCQVEFNDTKEKKRIKLQNLKLVEDGVQRRKGKRARIVSTVDLISQCPGAASRYTYAVPNSQTLLLSWWRSYEDGLRSWWKGKAAKDQRREALAEIWPSMVERRGNTLDADGEDVADLAQHCPELNYVQLANSAEGLILLFEELATLNLRSAIQSCVVHVMDTEEGSRRRDYFSAKQKEAFDRGEPVVESDTGEVCDTKVEARSEGEMMTEMMKAQRRRENFEWVPNVMRRAAMDRLAILQEFLLRCTEHYFVEQGVQEDPIKRSSVFGCLVCGKNRTPNNKSRALKECDVCKAVFVCSEACLRRHREVLHDALCKIQTTGLSKAHERTMDRISEEVAAMRQPTSMADIDPTTGLSQQSMEIVKKYCDMKKNAADIYGDGDQRPFPSGVEKGVLAMRQIWAEGGNFNPLSPSNVHSDFMREAFCGNVTEVKRMIEQTARSVPDGSKTPVVHLVNKRESILRLSPLHGCIAGARLGRMTEAAEGRWYETAQALIEAGSRVDARDFCGFTCVHHCATAYATTESLSILPLLLAKGAELQVANRIGEWPIHEPAMSGKVESVRTLIQFGADPYASPPGLEMPMSASSLARLNPTLQDIIARCAPNRHLKVGDPVKFQGLVQKPHLNGKTGIIEEKTAGKYVVLIDDTGDRIMVKMENVTGVSEDLRCAHCGKAEGTDMQRCGQCRHTRYCGKECQRAHWPKHKADCKRLAQAVQQKTLTIPKARLARDKTVHSVNIGTSARSSASTGAAVTEGEVVLKIQVPCVDMMTRAPDRSGKVPMMIYDAPRKIEFQLARAPDPTLYDRLLEAVVTKGVEKLKGYFLARVDPLTGNLLVNEEPIAPQPF